MAKISELTSSELSMNIDKYTKRVAEEPEVEKYQKVLMQLNAEKQKREEAKFKISPTSDLISPSEKKQPGGIQKFHSNEVDYKSLSDASFKHRALAAALDGVFYTIVSQLFAAVMTAGMKSEIIPATVGGIIVLLGSIIILPIFYYVLPIIKTGQTIGKKILKIKIVSQLHNENLSAGNVIKREFLGKFISSVVFMMGFLVRAFGKPAWHDSIAKTRVVTIS